MKLSEMNMREMAGALCKMAEPLANIARDEALCAKITSMRGVLTDEKKPVMLKAGELLTAVPEILDRHYADTMQIIAALLLRDVRELEEQNAFEAISEAISSVDGKLLDFFRSSAATAQTVAGSAK